MISVGRYSRCLVWLALILLAGCAAAPPPSPGADAASVEHWQIEGKLGYRSPGHNGSAWLDWRQNGDRFDLSLRGPLGVGATRIRGDASGAVLQRGDEMLRARSASELTLDVLGLSLPVEQLADWAKGVPARAPRPDRMEYDEAGHLVVLEQAGWVLRFDRQRAAGNDLVLPGRIRGARGELSFTLVVGEWTLLPQKSPDQP